MTEEDSVLGLLFKQLEDEKSLTGLALVTGGAKDFMEYRHMCGKIYGLSIAQAMINETADRLRSTHH